MQVSWAALRPPQACFVLLDAPDVVRVVRLMGRQDPFDQPTASSAVSAAGSQQWAEWADPEAGLLFSAAEGAYLAALVERGGDGSRAAPAAGDRGGGATQLRPTGHTSQPGSSGSFALSEGGTPSRQPLTWSRPRSRIFYKEGVPFRQKCLERYTCSTKEV
jgi:hypothetical protein